MSLPESLANLIKKHKEVSQKEKAEIEERIWTLRLGRTKSEPRRACLIRLLGGSNNYEISTRRSLLFAPTELWRRIDAGMSLGTAMRLYREARRRFRQEGGSIEDALQKTIVTYEALPVSTLPDGSVYHKSSPTRLKLQSPKLQSTRKSVRNRQSLYVEIRSVVAAYATEKIFGLEPLVADRLVSSLEHELKALLLHWGDQVHNAKNRRKVVLVVGRRQLAHAFRVLGLDPLHPGEILQLDIVRVRWRKLVNEYHPDRRGSDVTRPQFEAVMNAWKTIQAYSEQEKQNGHHDRKPEENHEDAV